MTPDTDRLRELDGPESLKSLATSLRKMADLAVDQIDADRLVRAAALVDEVDRLRDAYRAGYSDAGREISQTALGQSAEAAHAQNHQLRKEVDKLREALDLAVRVADNHIRDQDDGTSLIHELLSEIAPARAPLQYSES
jgi:hypothetical protein